MNYYNPYFSTIPYSVTQAVSSSRGLLGTLFGGGRLSAIISGTQKTLGVVNQAIPLVKQISPVMKNAKTMFRVMNEFKKVDNVTPKVDNSNTSSNQNQVMEEKALEPSQNIQETNNNGPTFFL